MVFISNEEMAVKIQQGDSGYIAVLWNKVYRFIDMQAGRFLEDYPEHYRQLHEDMVNESYFAFLKAIEGFNPDKGRFITYLGWKIRNTFTEVVQGGSRKRDPLNEAVSYEMPVMDGEGLTIMETLSEEHSTPDRAILAAEYRHGVSAFLDEALEHVTDGTGRELIKFMYDHNCGLAQASRRLYGDIPVPVYQYRKGLDQIRRFTKKDSIQNKMSYWGLDDYISCAGTSVSSFKKRRFTSSVEAIVMKRESLTEKIVW